MIMRKEYRISAIKKALITAVCLLAIVTFFNQFVYKDYSYTPTSIPKDSYTDSSNNFTCKSAIGLTVDEFEKLYSEKYKLKFWANGDNVKSSGNSDEFIHNNKIFSSAYDNGIVTIGCTSADASEEIAIGEVKFQYFDDKIWRDVGEENYNLKITMDNWGYGEMSYNLRLEKGLYRGVINVEGDRIITEFYVR